MGFEVTRFWRFCQVKLHLNLRQGSKYIDILHKDTIFDKSHQNSLFLVHGAIAGISDLPNFTQVVFITLTSVTRIDKSDRLDLARPSWLHFFTDHERLRFLDFRFVTNILVRRFLTLNFFVSSADLVLLLQHAGVILLLDLFWCLDVFGCV